MAADMLATPAELASFLQQDVDTATATLLIEMATGKIQAVTGQRIVAATSTALIHLGVWDGWYDDQWLPLPQLPVRSVATVLIDGVADTTFKLRNQQLWRLQGWSLLSTAPPEITVTYSHGYLAGAQGLQLARSYALALAGAGYSTPSGGAVAAESLDDYRIEYAAGADARMQINSAMADQLRNAYGSGAYVTNSR